MHVDNDIDVLSCDDEKYRTHTVNRKPGNGTNRSRRDDYCYIGTGFVRFALVCNACTRCRDPAMA